MSRILGPIQDLLRVLRLRRSKNVLWKSNFERNGPIPFQSPPLSFPEKELRGDTLNYSSRNHLLIIMLAGGNESWNLKQLGITSLPVLGLSSEELFNWIAICQRYIELVFEPYIIFFILKISKQEFQQRRTSPLTSCRNVLLWTKAWFELFPNTPGLWSDWPRMFLPNLAVTIYHIVTSLSIYQLTAALSENGMRTMDG